MQNGKLRLLDSAMLRTLGEWRNLFLEAIEGTEPSGIEVSKKSDFIQKRDNTYYLFCDNLPMGGDENVATTAEENPHEDSFKLDKKIKSVKWLESGTPLKFTQNGEDVTVFTSNQPYGQSVVIRIAKIETE